MFSDKKISVILGAVAVFFVALDRFLKALAWQNQEGYFTLIPGLLEFRFVLNPYIAFSIPFGGFWLAVTLAAVFIALVAFFLSAVRSGRLALAAVAWLVILGAGSNLLDRLRYGAVIDYLDLRWFTVFNIADAMIVVGVGFLLLQEIITNNKNKTANSKPF